MSKKIEWTPYLATAYAEGFCEGETATAEEQLEAFGYIVRSGMLSGLQGWYGRAAQDLVDNDLLDWEGNTYPENL